MNIERLKAISLRIFLRVLSLGMLAAFVPWITLILLKSPVLRPGGSLAPLLRFQPYNASYESMLVAIHLVWAIMLWRTSNAPERHIVFLDFTIWANAAHGAVMIVATAIQKGALMTIVESVPLLLIAAALIWLRPPICGRASAVA